MNESERRFCGMGLLSSTMFSSLFVLIEPLLRFLPWPWAQFAFGFPAVFVLWGGLFLCSVFSVWVAVRSILKRVIIGCLPLLICLCTFLIYHLVPLLEGGAYINHMLLLDERRQLISVIEEGGLQLAGL